MPRSNQLRLKWIAILMLSFYVVQTEASLTLYIDRKFAVEDLGLDVKNDVFLVNNGVKNSIFENPKLFRETTNPISAKVKRIVLTWQALNHEERYSLRVTSSNPKILRNPIVDLTALRGTVKKVSKAFVVYLTCTGLVGGVADIHFALNYTDYKKTSRISLNKTLDFTVRKNCEGNEGTTTSNKNSNTVDRSVVVTVSAVLAVVLCAVVGAVFFLKYIKRNRRRFDEGRERLTPPDETFPSPIRTISPRDQLPTVVYSPNGNGSGHCITRLSKHENLITTTPPQDHSHSCRSVDSLNTCAVINNGNFQGQCSSNNSSQDSRLFTAINVADDDVFIAEESDVALIENGKHDSAITLVRDVDQQLAFTTLNEYWLEKLGDSIKSREEIEIRADVLGEGKFGRVLRGKWLVACQSEDESVDLAVKICQENIEFEHMVSFVNEAILMKRLSHANIINLQGVILQPTAAPLILTPYMAHGDLHKFLRHSRGIGIRRQLIGSRQLVNFASQIARGMEYLTTQKVVHRDLAARNCLVDRTLHIKISDLSLAREVNQFDMYKLEHPTQLAVKWLALESLLYYLFTEKSDVWSFGIVLWELVTLGSQPYAGLDNYEVIPYLESRKRLPRPLRCPDDLYSIMQSCWLDLPEERPPFSVLVHKLEDYEQRLRPSCITFEFDEDTIEMTDSCGSF